ncbi:MAG: hypothetical protein KIT54_04050 [Phycisphaeraceae bacterium]|nr:hypothetical protein [Phycisphaeraceae bacterium]
MTSPLPEDIRSRLESISAHKQRINEIGKRLTEIIQHTEEHLLANGVHLPNHAFDPDVDKDIAIAWMKINPGEWRLMVCFAGEGAEYGEPLTWAKRRAVKASISEKAVVLSLLPRLLDSIGAEVTKTRERFDSVVEDWDLKGGV